ncbi:Tropomodulin, putative [Pediculus humanus corporis]|uniref:Tropomodulin, putative n=1 Tax=Pediculus humanus subsp. corporis TaxID=121224 RepID=E0V9Q2_PEDHC|nr:Tropomodulin, putative [Pediculus humanus corporis]EEB10087.1 Tropomodulin, putative [Pediculus humanus corporis]
MFYVIEKAGGVCNFICALMKRAKEVDPDDNLLPPSQRCSYECDKNPTGIESFVRFEIFLGPSHPLDVGRPYPTFRVKHTSKGKQTRRKWYEKGKPKEVDPDDNLLPPSQRCSYECDKNPTGPLDRKKLIEHINKQALETPDKPELKPFVPGVIRGKKWVPPPPSAEQVNLEEKISIDLGDEYEQALADATQEEIIDLAAILGFHSMMNQDQYHASLLNKGQPVGLGWDGITKASKLKFYPQDPPNTTDVDKTIEQVKSDDSTLTNLNWNNIKNISDEKFEQLFEALKGNTYLEILSLTNVGMTDHVAMQLAEALEQNKTLRVVNIETNFISPPIIVKLIKSLLKTKTVEEFRASNQRSQVLGNKIEMEITNLVEQNPTLLRLGLHLEYNDARHRVANHLQRNIDRSAFKSHEFKIK